MGKNLKKILTYLPIILPLIGAFLALPEIIWQIQEGTTQLVCPTTLTDKFETFTLLKNNGLVFASLNVTYTSDKIQFIDDYGTAKNTVSVGYYVEPKNIQPTPFRFKPTFNNDIQSAFIQINVDCYTYFGIFCKPATLDRCCRYSSNGAISQLKLSVETVGKC